MQIFYKKRERDIASNSLRTYYEKHYFLINTIKMSCLGLLLIHDHKLVSLAMYAHDTYRGFFSKILAQVIDVYAQ